MIRDCEGLREQAESSLLLARFPDRLDLGERLPYCVSLSTILQAIARDFNFELHHRYSREVVSKLCRFHQTLSCERVLRGPSKDLDPRLNFHRSAMMLNSLWILPLLLVLVSANVEKVIFVAPEAQSLPQDASIDNLLLSSLSETTPSIRTYLNASFPTEDAPKGTETWMLLEELVPGRRYEVRICWLATVRIFLS